MMVCATRSRLPVGALCLVMAACITWGQPPLEQSVGDDETAIQVENEGSVDATVYVMDGASRNRVGLVTAHTIQTFKVPATMLQAESSLQLYAKPVSRRGYMLPIVQVGAGQKVALTLTDDPAYWSVAVMVPKVPRLATPDTL